MKTVTQMVKGVRRIIKIFFSILLLSSCSKKYPEVDIKPNLYPDKQTCAALQGKWVDWEVPFCLMPLSRDAGKMCIDSTACVYYCIAPNANVKPGSKGTGVCSELNRTNGCTTYYVKGVATGCSYDGP